tara:strand:+ start:8301 stop:9257 length:957 start_codon:yes stop_codon:yes gene_type:complete
MKRKSTEIFSMSFLDIMSCGFGAIVLILLISQFKTNEVVKDVIPKVSLIKLEETLKLLEKESNILETNLSKISDEENDIKKKLEITINLSKSLLSNVAKSSQENKKLSQEILNIKSDAKNVKLEIANAGGLNVESDYIVFIIDNSGSMQDWGPWGTVISEISKIIDAFPNLKGFQILNDQGRKMVKNSDKWIDDTLSNRKLMKQSIKNFRGTSRSNPIDGLRVALTRYANGIDKVGIFVIGDDISLQEGERIEDYYNEIHQLNTINNKMKARINGVAFLTARSASKDYIDIAESMNINFLNFINELAYENMGSVVVVK